MGFGDMRPVAGAKVALHCQNRFELQSFGAISLASLGGSMGFKCQRVASQATAGFQKREPGSKESKAESKSSLKEPLFRPPHEDISEELHDRA